MMMMMLMERAYISHPDENMKNINGLFVRLLMVTDYLPQPWHCILKHSIDSRWDSSWLDDWTEIDLILVED